MRSLLNIETQHLVAEINFLFDEDAFIHIKK